jgi:homogentisate 1,2-dioxygenase
VTSAEAAKARAEKFKPKQPSSLRNVTQMSPLQMEKENIMLRSQITSHGSFAQLLAQGGITLEQWQETDALHDNFFRHADPEVMAAVNALSDDQIVDYPLPPSLLSLLQPEQSEVEKEVERFFH